MSAPARLSLQDLAEGGGALRLSRTGTPECPTGVVDLVTDAPHDLVAAATTEAARSGRVLVGLAEAPPGPAYDGLLEALAFTVVPTGSSLTRAVVAHDEPERLLAELGDAVAAAPRAAVTLVRLLRLTSALPVLDGLVAESLAYSTLLAGPEFASWLDARARRPVKVDTGPPVLLARRAETLQLILNRPKRHNAYSRSVRDALVEGLELALADPSLRCVELTGAGRSFCSGGDLDEFGTTPDVATAHVVRVERSAGALLHACRDRVVARVHGACIGAGVELAAFADRVEADSGAFFQLPELRMGLVPGAGGTVSVTRRVGRWRTAYLALTGCRLDAEVAVTWGLVDDVRG